MLAVVNAPPRIVLRSRVTNGGSAAPIERAAFDGHRVESPVTLAGWADTECVDSSRFMDMLHEWGSRTDDGEGALCSL